MAETAEKFQRAREAEDWLFEQQREFQLQQYVMDNGPKCMHGSDKIDAISSRFVYSHLMKNLTKQFVKTLMPKHIFSLAVYIIVRLCSW